MFLDCIICQVNILIIELLRAKIHRTSPNISLFIPIPFKIAIYRCQKHKTSEIELAFLKQQRPIDVLLDDKGSRFTIFSGLTIGEFSFDLCKRVADNNALTAI